MDISPSWVQEHVEGFTWLQLLLGLTFLLLVSTSPVFLLQEEPGLRRWGRFLLAGCLLPLGWLLMDMPEWFGFTVPIAVGLASLTFAAILVVVVVFKTRWRR